MDFDLTIYLTNRCNLFCDHCDRSSGNAAPNELSTAEILALVDSLKNAENGKLGEIGVPQHATKQIELNPNSKELKHICLSGGEPVQYKDFFYIAETLIKKGFQVSFITNATFSPAYYQRILELPFTGIYVSLDGTEKIHNSLRRSGLSFKRVIQFLEFLNSFSGNLYVVTCVTSKSVNDLEALSELLSKYKVTKWFLKPIQMKGRALEHPELELGDSEKIELENFKKYLVF